jgi:hypothetical protein
LDSPSKEKFWDRYSTVVPVRQRRFVEQSSVVKTLAERFDLNPKTVAKWRKRKDFQDELMEPKQAHSTVLTPEEEINIVAFRKHTLLPLDDCLYPLYMPYKQVFRTLHVHPCTVV